MIVLERIDLIDMQRVEGEFVTAMKKSFERFLDDALLVLVQ